MATKIINYWSESIKNKREEYYVTNSGNIEGKYYQYHKNGKKEEEYTFHPNGLLQGLYLSWFEDGNLSCMAHYEKSELEGRCLLWHENGQIAENLEYKKGMITKVLLSYDTKGRDCILREGNKIVWKLGFSKNNYVFINIYVPSNAKRVTPKQSLGMNISRIEFGIVIDIVDEKGRHYKEAESCIHIRNKLKYVVGELVFPDGYNGYPNVSSGQGISVHLYKDQCKKWLHTRSLL
jgi:hypothetical protein